MEARVWLTGTPENPVLNFDLPVTRGGSDGSGGSAEPPQIRIGVVGTGEPGSRAEATITGTAPDYILNLTIPRGADGINGTDGVDGVDGNDGVDGSDATVVKTNIPFIVRYRSGAWEYTTLAQAQAAGLATNQTVWFVGGTSAPSWARSGDLFTQP